MFWLGVLCSESNWISHTVTIFVLALTKQIKVIAINIKDKLFAYFEVKEIHYFANLVSCLIHNQCAFNPQLLEQPTSCPSC